MRYLYYPGCSLESSAPEYDRSTRALFAALGAELGEIQDWTCCGASAAEAANALLALALPARNLALAERQEEGADILVPCSACYLNLRHAQEKTRRDPLLAARVRAVLAEDGLRPGGRARVRHLLDALAADFGPQAIGAAALRPLAGLTIAPYYGCQCLRPYADFDDPEWPVSMEPLLRAAGAEIFPWPAGARCCGAAHTSAQREVGLARVADILAAAAGADAIATVCPMCQMNLEAFQAAAGRRLGRGLWISVLYLTQLLGLALGLLEADLGLDRNLSLSRDFVRRLEERPRR
jgi:heterodisulfide reductase subunit B